MRLFTKKTGLGIAAMMFVLSASGCSMSKVTCDSLLNDYAEQSKEYQSVSMVVTTETDSDIQFEGIEPVNSSYVIKTTVDTVGKDAHIMIETKSAEGDVSLQEDYYIYDENESRLIDYVCDASENVMYQARPASDFAYQTAVLDIRNMLSDLTLEQNTTEFNGTECYVFDGKMTWDHFRTTVGVDSVSIVPDIEEGTDMSDILFDTKIYFSKEGHNLTGLSIDAKEPLTAAIGRSVIQDGTYSETVNKTLVTATDIQFNTGKTIELPADMEVIK